MENSIKANVTDIEAGLTANQALGAIVVYVKNENNVPMINFFLTDAYQEFDGQLKQDITEAVGALYKQMKGE